MNIPIVVTERLVLRTTLASDADILHKLVFSVPEVMAETFSGNTLSKAESLQFVEDHFDHTGTGKQLGVLTLKHSHEIIGFAGLLSTTVLGEDDYEIGFVLGKDYWEKGYASEIGRAQIDYGLGLLKCNRLLAFVKPTNTASIAIIEKIGLSRHSTIDTQGRGVKHVYMIEEIVR